MSDTIDYEAVDVPPETDPADYTYAERRAEILTAIRDAGHPRLVNQKQLADRYDCAPSNIHNDMGELSEYVAAGLSDRHALVTEAVFQRCLRELLDAEGWRKAAKTAGEYSEWVHDRGEMAELYDRLDVLEEQAEDGGTRALPGGIRP